MSTPKKNDFLLLNVPLLRPAWPVPTFSRTYPLLTANGFQGDWWDENIRFFRYFYSEKKLAEACQIIREKDYKCTNEKHKEIYKKLLQLPISSLVAALNDISDPKIFFKINDYKKSFKKVFINCAQILSYAYDVAFDYNQLSYRSPIDNIGYNFSRVSDVIELVNGAYQNISLEFFVNDTIPRINAFAPKFIGISISSAFELVPAFSLARLVKEKFNDKIHVTIGGNYFSRIEHRFRNAEPQKELYETFWKWMDSYIYTKGEDALSKLVECIINRHDLKSVPNLVYKDKNKIIENSFSYGQGIDELPPSNFGSILKQKHLYFVPPEFLTVPIYTSIGCSYAKCTFCAIDKMSGNFQADLDIKRKNGTKFLTNNAEQTFRFFRQPQKILEEMLQIKESYDISFFSFNDETFDMDFAMILSEEIIKENKKIFWQAFARVEDELVSPIFCQRLYEGGCRLLRIGFEYLSQDKLNQIRKGYSLKKQQKVLESLNKAGIWVHGYFMINSEEDFQDITNFFLKNPEYCELFHTVELFSQVNERHSLENLQNLKQGVVSFAEMDIDFPEFRIWYDAYPKARNIVKTLRKFAQNNLPTYKHLNEPSEVAYYPVLNEIHGLNDVKKIVKDC